GITAEIDPDHLARHVHRERRQAILELAQFFGASRADNIGPCRQELPELHITRPQFRQGTAQFAIAMRTQGHEPREAEAKARRPWQGGSILRGRQGIVPRHHPASTRKAEHVTDKPHQMRQPQWMATMPPERHRWPTWRKPASPIIDSNLSA